MYFGKFVMRKIEVRRKEPKGFYKYRKNAKTLGDVQSTPPQYNGTGLVIVKMSR